MSDKMKAWWVRKSASLDLILIAMVLVAFMILCLLVLTIPFTSQVGIR